MEGKNLELRRGTTGLHVDLENAGEDMSSKGCKKVPKSANSWTFFSYIVRGQQRGQHRPLWGHQSVDAATVGQRGQGDAPELQLVPPPDRTDLQVVLTLILEVQVQIWHIIFFLDPSDPILVDLWVFQIYNLMDPLNSG